MTESLLSVRDLGVSANGRPVLRDVSFELAPGEVHGIVGESGAGKSTIVKLMLGILPRTMEMTRGRVEYRGRDLFALAPAAFRALLGAEIALIPQDPLTALNPGRRIDAQLTDGFRLKRKLPRREADARAIALLEEVHIREPHRVMRAYPHELSGGMRQRVLIAAAFALDPKLVIADEPTTALDVTVQKQILRLIRGMQERHGTAIVFVTHDLGVVAQICDTTSVMYMGKVVEQGPTDRLLTAPAHPYTAALIAANPRYDRPEVGLTPIPARVIERMRAEIAADDSHG
ncbi:MAG TPA: ABC transporter ATP-binding protein [Stellaceae bacterium]